MVRAVSFSAARKLADGPLTFRIMAKEKDGFDAREFAIETRARAWQPPQLQIENQTVRRGEGNLLIVSYEVLNQGKGAGLNVTVTVAEDERIVLRNEEDRQQRLGRIEPGERRTVELGVYTSLRPGEILRLPVTLREGQESQNLQEALALQVPASDGIDAGTLMVAYVPAAGVEPVADVSRNIPVSEVEQVMAVGVVIGNGNYANLDAVKFAHRDATTVAGYVASAMGYGSDAVRTESDMTARDFRRLFGTRERGFRDGALYRRVALNAQRRENPPVFVYYSGHGAPSLKEEGRAYLVPVDTTLRDLDYDGYSLDDFYASIAALPSDNVTVVLDACFSGASNDGLLQKDISPALLKTADTITPIETSNAAVFTSTSPSQVSYWYNDARHSLFTYFFLKGLQGGADDNHDNKVTTGELHDYLGWNVADHILKTDKPSDQTPQLVGDRDRIMAALSGKVL